MKKSGVIGLACIFLAFVCFSLGFFCARAHQTGTVLISVIPTAAPSEASLTTTTESVFPVNINTADPETLDALPGIGPVLAQRIVDYRNANGAFSSPEELTNVSGIGPAILEDLLPYITTGG